MSESTISKNIRAALIARGARPIKYHGGPYSEAGIPDLLVAYRGRFIFLETKQPGETPTPIQRKRMTELSYTPEPCALIRTGPEAIGGVVETVDQALSYLNAVDAAVLDEQHFLGFD